jgi:hypothetical protein
MMTQNASTLIFPNLWAVMALATCIDASPSAQSWCCLWEDCMTFRCLVRSVIGLWLRTRSDFLPLAVGTSSMMAVHTSFMDGVCPGHKALATLPVGRMVRHD